MLGQASALEHGLDLVVAVLVAEFAQQVLARRWVHEVLVQLPDRRRHAVLLEGVVVTHPTRSEDEQERVLQLASFPSFSAFVLLPQEFQSSGEDVAHNCCAGVFFDDRGTNEPGNS